MTGLKAHKSERVYQLESDKFANMCIPENEMSHEYLLAFAAPHDVKGQGRE